MPERPIPWDIYEEHLDEATFLWEQWEQSLSAWHSTLEEVARGPEERLFAHLDALVLGGSHVADELCQPALESDEPARVAAAVWVLLHVDGRDRWDDGWRILSAADTGRRNAAARAYALSLRSDTPARVSAELGRLSAPLKGCLIDVLRIRDPGVLPNLPLSRWASEPDPELLGGVLRAARRASIELSISAVERGLVSELSETRIAAIELGTSLHIDRVRADCRRLVAEGAQEIRMALAALAIGGDAADLKRLRECAENGIGPDAVWALGFAGSVESAEAALCWLEDPNLGPSAAETFSTITGLELDGELAAPPLPELDDLADDVPLREPEPGDDLPRADAPAVRAWWQRNGNSFRGEERYFRGHPWKLTLPLSALESTATWRLQGARLGLSRSEGASLELRGWARHSRLAHRGAVLP